MTDRPPPRRQSMARLHTMWLCAALAAASIVDAQGGDAAAATSSVVTCGSSVKLALDAARALRLHSGGVAYGRGSRQQAVTALPSSGDARSHFTILAAPGAPCAPGAAVARRQRVRLLHAASRKWLRASDAFESPLTANYEVCLAGGGGGGGGSGDGAVDDSMSSDGGDVWVVDWAPPPAQQRQQQQPAEGDYWRQDTRVSLQHAATGGYLTALRHAEFGRPVPGSPPGASRSREVCALAALGPDGWWAAAEGLYLPVRTAIGDGGLGAAVTAPVVGNATNATREEL